MSPLFWDDLPFAIQLENAWLGFRSDPAWAGCWCSRQALKCAAAAVRLSRDVIASLRSAGFIASGPRSPTPGAPYTYVTTKHFLSAFGMETLRDLPDIEALDDAGLLDARIPLGNGYAEESPDEDE